jgi:hypothetical protein
MLCFPLEPPMPVAARNFPWFAALLALIGGFGLAAAWVAVAMISWHQSAWMALLAALDAAFLLRLGGAKPGLLRMALGVAATLLAIALANWGIVAAHMAGMMGMGISDAALKLGPSLAWTLSTLANAPTDIAWLLAGIVLAAVASR